MNGEEKRQAALAWQRSLSLAAPVSDHHWRAVSELWEWVEPLRQARGSDFCALEIGCGEPPYLTLRMLREHYIDALGFDGLAKAGENGVENGDIHDLPYGDGIFDLVVARHVLEHALSPYEVLMEMRRVSNGWLLVILPWYSDKARNWPDHLWHMSKSGWARLFEKLALPVERFAVGDHTEQWAIDQKLWSDRELRFLLRAR